MNSPGGDSLRRFTEPRDVAFDMGEGNLPMNARIHSPFIISNWKTAQYQQAVMDAIPSPGILTDSELGDLDMGCHWAANRASTYTPFQVSSLHQHGGGRSELTREELSVVGLLGYDKFMALQRTAPPKELIDYMLSGGNDPLARPSLDQITVAVIKGHLEWEPRFADAGVPLPQDYIESRATAESDYRRRLESLYPGEATGRRGFGQAVRRMLSTLFSA